MEVVLRFEQTFLKNSKLQKPIRCFSINMEMCGKCNITLMLLLHVLKIQLFFQLFRYKLMFFDLIWDFFLKVKRVLVVL